MDDAAPTVLRCEDCGAVRPDDGPGWLRVAYPVSNRHASGAEVFLYYCPAHAAAFDVHGPGVAPVAG